MRFLWRSIMGLFLTAVTLGLLGYAGNMVRGAIESRMAEETRQPPVRERVFSVNVVTAKVGTERPLLEAFGEVRASRSLELRAAAPGRVIEMSAAFVEGGSVKAGEVLLRIDPTDAESNRDRSAADLEDARAEVRDADAALVLARDDLEAARAQAELRGRALTRQRNLETRGVGTAAAVETAELSAAAADQAVLSKRQAVTQAAARVSQSATRLRRSEIALKDAERKVDDTVVTAPFDGTLTDVTLTLGRLVANNEKLAGLVDPRALEVAFRLSTTQYARLLDSAGALSTLQVEATIDVTGIDLIAQGQIARDSAAVGEAQSGRLIFATLDDAPGFKPGDFVTVKVEEPEVQRVARLPASALDASSTVLALSEGNRLESIPVALIRRQGNDILVRARDLDGREIVATRTPLLGSGLSVRPVRPAVDGANEQLAAVPEMVELDADRRARLIAFVEGNNRMPKDVKDRILTRLGSGDAVPAQMVTRLESRMGG